jgi:hypothetical protein
MDRICQDANGNADLALLPWAGGERIDYLVMKTIRMPQLAFQLRSGTGRRRA